LLQLMVGQICWWNIMSLKDKVQRIKSKQTFHEIEELMIIGRYIEAKEKIEGLDKQFLNAEAQLRCEAWLSHCTFKVGDFQKAEDIANRVLKEGGNNPQYQESIVDAKLTLGLAYVFLGELGKSSNLFDEAEKIIQSLDSSLRKNKSREAILQYGRGTKFVSKGESEEGISFLSKGVLILEEIGNIVDTGAMTNNIGEGYRIIGNLELALEHYNQAYEYALESGYGRIIAITLGNVGLTEYLLGHTEKSSEIFDESIEMLEELDLGTFLQSILFYAVKVAIDQEDIERANAYLERMATINEEIKTLFISQHYRVAKAIVQMKTDNLVDRDRARDLFKEVVQEEITVFEVTVIALLNLCDILFQELRNTGNVEIMDEINEYTEMIHTIAKDQGSFWLEAETNWMHAQMALIKADYEGAKRLLTRAQLIADEKGLFHLARRISREFDALLDEQ